MTEDQLRCFMALLMCSDPWPVDVPMDSQSVLEELANNEAQKRGWRDWIEAYHAL